MAHFLCFEEDNGSFLIKLSQYTHKNSLAILLSIFFDSNNLLM